jgi:alcohol dehydrogenase (cytochrome c)
MKSLDVSCLILAVLAGGVLQAEARQGRPFTPVTDAMLADPDPADWLMWRRTTNGWGYSPLDQVDRGNVRSLALVWTRPLGAGVQEGTPLVHDGRMFFPNPNDRTQAIDAVTGDLLWEYQREWPEDLGQYIPFAQINRNLAIYGTTILDLSGDDYLYALDALTGEPVWETLIADYRIHGAQQTSGPITANGKIFSSRGCEPEGGPEACVITAHDARTGEELWRRRTIPAPGEPGDETWGEVPYENRWHVGAWMVPSYDIELDRLYVGTSVTSPAPKFIIGSNDDQYLYHNSTLALDGETGEIVWYYQHVVDHWDLDHPFERLLIDTAVAPDPGAVDWINPDIEPGEVRRVVTGIPGKTGIVYTLDRETGEFLWARPTVPQTVVDSISGSGEVRVNPEMVFDEVGDQALVCPGTSGGKGFPAGAYSPLTHTMIYPLQNACMNVTASSGEQSLNSIYGITTRGQIAPGTQSVGTLHAISVETGADVWKYEQRAGMMSALATGGLLVFAGDANGRFRAFDQESGEVLWEVNLGSAVTGYPVTYAVDGRQYVVVSTGNSLVSGAMNGLTPELRTGTAANLYVFALPE